MVVDATQIFFERYPTIALNATVSLRKICPPQREAAKICLMRATDLHWEHYDRTMLAGERRVHPSERELTTKDFGFGVRQGKDCALEQQLMPNFERYIFFKKK